MLIESMTRQASIDLLARTNLGRLACAHDALSGPSLEDRRCVRCCGRIWGGANFRVS